MKEDKEIQVGSARALVPFLIFVGIYLGAGMFFVSQGDPMGFYVLKAPIAILIGIISGFLIIKGKFDDKFDVFVKGCGDSDIIIMIMIYMLAGAFSTVSEAMGGVDSVVNLGLNFIPPSLITIGIFVIAGFISVSTGTSVGTIAAVGPIAVGFADKTGVSLALMIAALIGGAMFGDNLSIISDTTIASTRTQGCSMKDKFRTSLMIALPAMVITVILLYIFGRPESIADLQAVSYDYELVKVIPYLFVLIFALMGMNVFVVLGMGLLISGIIGLFYGEFDLVTFTQLSYDGFAGMFEMVLLAILSGGLAALVTYGGGIQWILNKIEKVIKNQMTAEFGIGAIVSLIDAAVANNTVAIIISGPTCRRISETYRIDPRRSATLLSCYSTFMQGLIPYGAQVLIAAGLTRGAVSPLEIIPLLWYQFIVLLLTIGSSIFPFANGYIHKHPWDFEKWTVLEECPRQKSITI